MAFVASSLAAAGCGSGDAAKNTTTTVESTTTTEAAPTLSADARRAVILCVDAQEAWARSMSFDLATATDEAAAKTKCDDAQAYIDTEAPATGPNVPRSIAVAIAANNYALARWNVDILIGGEAKPTDEGVLPIEAQFRWRSEIDQLLAQLPAL